MFIFTLIYTVSSQCLLGQLQYIYRDLLEYVPGNQTTSKGFPHCLVIVNWGEVREVFSSQQQTTYGGSNSEHVRGSEVKQGART